MKVKFERVGKNIGPPIYLDNTVINKNTFIFAEIVVRVGLFEGESVFITFGKKEAGGDYEAITEAIMMLPRNFSEDGKNGVEYYRAIPSNFVKESGIKPVSIAITQKITGTDSYSQITSGIAFYEIGENVSSTDYETIDDGTAIMVANTLYEARADINAIDAKVDNLLQDPVYVDDGGARDVKISEDGGLVFYNLEGPIGPIGPEGPPGGVSIPLYNGLVTLYAKGGRLWARVLTGAENPYRIENGHLILRLPIGGE